MLILFCGIASLAPAVFFAYATSRIAGLIIASAGYRNGTAIFGAVAFALSAIVFAVVSWFCITKALRGLKLK